MSNPSTQAAEAMPSEPRLKSAWTDHPVAITAAIGIGILLSIGAYFALDSGDEPPIRVQNGSLDLQLLTRHEHWIQQGDARHWKISGGARSKDLLDISVAVNTGASCDAQAGSGHVLTLTYNDGATVQAQSSGNHTSVVSSADLTLSAKGHLLTYSASGWISRITLDKALTCNFSAKNQLADMVILDY